ncbi:carboxypeptidase-like regulatory domain-containing protein [Roseivirga misakiensis]|uniref:carboxypeptidase-like regulatory domain-containing protein n=1 Tax=Roseivirga misakiensis TaxID=1563681 RepID=UPI000B48B29E|nr:carboxypeptidase-like regulatory domain-containing protein [Roseivirga misakiensis]
MKRLILLSLIAFSTIAISNDAEAQILSTKLKITVVDELGNVVPDAKVILFANEADYNKEVNPVQPFKLTDSKGRVTFKKLDTKSYYIIVRKGDKDNSGGGEVVSKLVKGKVNKANIVISDGI